VARGALVGIVVNRRPLDALISGHRHLRGRTGMKILHQDSRTNEIKLLPESIDDLWHLYNLLDVDDTVFASTYRRKEDKADKIRPERTEKIRMRLGVGVKKVEFHESEDRLRILGYIESGPQDIGQHHTLMIGPGDDVSIVKPKWNDIHFDRIKRAVDASDRPIILFVAIEDTEAVIAAARDYGLKEVASITRNPEGKMYDSKPGENDFVEEVVGKVIPMLKDQPLIVLGPGFTKEALARKVREKHPELADNIVVLSTGQAGMAGINEAMKRGLGGKAVEESRVTRETQAVERLFAAIGADGLFSYGRQSVETAAESGAVELLLVIDSLVRDVEIEKLLKTVERARGEFMIVSSLHEAGRRLESLGGVAALLRYRID
jgi:protein pelota